MLSFLRVGNSIPKSFVGFCGEDNWICFCDAQIRRFDGPCTCSVKKSPFSNYTAI